MPLSSQPSAGHLMSEEVRGSAGIPLQIADMTVMEVWSLCRVAERFCQLRWVCCCRRCTSASSWSAGKHKTSLSPPATRRQTSPSMCSKTGLQVSVCVFLFILFFNLKWFSHISYVTNVPHFVYLCQVYLNLVCFWRRNRDAVDAVQSAWWPMFHFSILTSRKAKLEKLRCWNFFNCLFLFKLCLFMILK